ncbi:MAG: aspartate kinase [Candidatus Delongbacteria bacterium]|nr:aspartate kinase [Candidatus Delongbacteria bacterium]
MKVMKFGGASLKDKSTFLSTAGIITRDPQDKIVVLSAVYQMTNTLEQLINDAKKNETLIRKGIDRIKTTHHIIASQCIENLEILGQTIQNIDDKIQKLERLLYGIAYTEEITKKIYALIMSFGERLAVIVMAGVLESIGFKSVYLESDKIGVISDDSFDNATAILPLVQKNLLKNVVPLIKEGYIPLVTGFFGVNQKGQVTLFGRNSSDYTAAVIAHGVKAKVLEIWKDVDGFMSADPKLVDKAYLIDKLSYYEAAELSYFGAKILHPRTVEPLIPESIPMVIKNLLHPDNSGTEIGPTTYQKESIIKSVTYNKNISVLKIQGAGVGYKPGVISEIGAILADSGINIYSIITSQTCINLLIDHKDADMSTQILQNLGDGIIDSIDHRDDELVVAVVGAGIDRTPGLAAKVFNAVARENINIEMISSGASDVATYFIVKESSLKTVVNAIHQEFFQ